MKRNIHILILSLATASMLGCETTPLCLNRVSVAREISSQAGFTKEYIKAGDFTLMTYQRFSGSSNILNIYIEGDGKAWETKYQLSDDPTPLNPVALRLAAVDPAANVAYIARPGQYALAGLLECDSKYWSKFRFAPEVISSFDKAIDLLKQESQAKYVKLIGYSGGGAIAVLVAARRSDVMSLRTVGGNLNPRAFCNYHHVSQLDGSMDPMGVAQEISNIPQRHFVGSRDSVVPQFIAWSFVKMQGAEASDKVTIVKGVSHTRGWPERWKYLLSISPL